MDFLLNNNNNNTLANNNSTLLRWLSKLSYLSVPKCWQFGPNPPSYLNI